MWSGVQMWRILCVLYALAGGVSAANGEDINVVRLQLPLEVEHTLQIDPSLEYILLFVPSLISSEFPSRVRVRSVGGDSAHPLLVTARQRSGAITWQLPYYSGEDLLYELERTLCPDDTADNTTASNCVDESETTRRGEFTLHLGSACASPFSVSLRVSIARDWMLPQPDEGFLETRVTQAAPRVHYFQWPEHVDSVQLFVQSEDDICVTVAMQKYECPILQTLDELDRSTMRMTIEGNGAAQISKSRYPRGFYVVIAMGDSDFPCSGETRQAVDPDWLWEAAVWPGLAPDNVPQQENAREKQIILYTKRSLGRGEYLLGTLVALLVFSLFYILFGMLVLAERWPAWYRLVAPKAVLADDNSGNLTAETEANNGRQRRLSTATFDSSDNSDTESDSDMGTATTGATPPLSPPRAATPPRDLPIATIQIQNVIAAPDELELRQNEVNGTSPTSNGGRALTEAASEAPRPFGLPARLHVAALSRRRAKVLRARSDRYLYTLYTVAVFYALPVVQFVASFQLVLNVSGSLDLCYYNFLCAHPLGGLSDFNHIFSNLGYLMLGALFMVQVNRRRRRRRRHPRHEDYGIPQHYGLLSSLGAGLMVVALLSASYHVCPNRLNFQFDTAFMYVLAVLSMVKIYQSRHPDINARAHATFGILAAMILLVVWGVLDGGALFWAVFTVLHVFTFLLLSLRIYYLGQFRLEKESLAETARSFREAPRPLYTTRLIALVLVNAVNWAFALYGLVMQPSDFASHLLFVLLGNTLLYIVFYLSMKLLHGERVRWYSWLALGGAALAWAPGLYFFMSGSTDWAATPARSRLLNHECRVLRFYDSHDLWHALSAVALYLTFTLMLTWDDGLSAVKRTEIAVF